MDRLTQQLTTGFLLVYSTFLPAYELGAWYKRPPEIPHAINTRFNPTFLILKTGIFSRNGNFKIIGEPNTWKKLCNENYKLTAWVTHRIKKTDVLSAEAAEKLGKALKQNFGTSCFNAVELDIEPLGGEETWLPQFVSKLKETTGSAFAIRLALPLLSEKVIKGPAFKKEAAERLLSLIDGIDFMLYDTGIKTKEEYQTLLKYNLETAKELLTKHPEKSILLGIPAYHERTSLHLDSIENISAFLTVLKSLTLTQVSKICTGQIRLSLYAAWTLSPEDRNTIKELKSWLEETCQKDK